MVRMVNRLTGTVMYVDESRVDEYMGRGHTLPPVPTTEEKPKAEKPKVEPKKIPQKKK
jgi:hypothetical protein